MMLLFQNARYSFLECFIIIVRINVSYDDYLNHRFEASRSINFTRIHASD